MAFKTFAPGVLTSSDVNTFLMRQAVITCTSSTRPASPSEGMTIYETDTDALAIYNGSAWQYRGYFESYTPTFTGLTLGNGTAFFESARIGDVVVVRGLIRVGSTTSVTAVLPATITFSLAVPAAGGAVSAAASVNLGDLRDDSAANRVPIGIRPNSSTAASLTWMNVAGAVVYYNSFNTTTTPFALAVDDQFRIQLTYEAA